jgi:hypothetical protein
MVYPVLGDDPGKLHIPEYIPEQYSAVPLTLRKNAACPILGRKPFAAPGSGRLFILQAASAAALTGAAPDMPVIYHKLCAEPEFLPIFR